ncbi:MAG TPA: hypothetical protein VH479_15385 [Acidimicrobiales bacterium]
MAVLPVPDVETSRQVGLAAIRVMLAVASESPPGAVIESNFRRSPARENLGQLPGRIVEVFCRVRHAGHFDSVRTPGELWNDEVSEPVAGGWPLVDVDTTGSVDLAQVVRSVRESADGL